MKKLTSFFLLCSGADSTILKKCPTETSKYAGMGATIFFTGVFASLAAGYALYMVFDTVWTSLMLGLVWGFMIFNLDRYIVSSMRKEGKMSRELWAASPRIFLAIIISIVIAKPLELKIFEKEINPELIIMEQEVYARQESQLKSRYQQTLDSLKAEREALRTIIAAKAKDRDVLVRIAQEEADGTGGSRRKNLGPIYKVKKADADKATLEFQEFSAQYGTRIAEVEKQISGNELLLGKELSGMEKSKLNGPAARIEALNRITQNSSAIAWANWFIILLFIAIETAPVLVKLISSKGPYDNLLKIEEHTFAVQEVEAMAKTNSQAKERSASLAQHERTYVSERLDAALKR